MHAFNFDFAEKRRRKNHPKRPIVVTRHNASTRGVTPKVYVSMDPEVAPPLGYYLVGFDTSYSGMVAMCLRPCHEDQGYKLIPVGKRVSIKLTHDALEQTLVSKTLVATKFHQNGHDYIAILEEDN